MKRGFVRALWGIHEHEGRRFYKRRTKQDDDIRLMLKNPYVPESKVYVFGEDNYAMTQELGMDAVLVDKRPIIWDMDTEQFRHKLEVFDRAMEDFDEMVFLDWDTIPVKPIPDNFWDVLGEKDAIQANSIMYRRRKAMWRGRSDSRKLSCAAFVYCRDKNITEGMLETWEEMGRPWSEELVMARHIDKINGGWQGLEHYWDHHEPHWFSMPKMYWSYPPERIRNDKDRIFHHFNKREVAKLLRKDNITNWDKWLS
jgi:hypothetical protein